jgi:hypothetical protein
MIIASNTILLLSYAPAQHRYRQRDILATRSHLLRKPPKHASDAKAGGNMKKRGNASLVGERHGTGAWPQPKGRADERRNGQKWVMRIRFWYEAAS